MIYASNDSLRAAISYLMSDGRERSTRQIAAALDTTGSRMRYTLQRMVSDGALDRRHSYGGTCTQYRARQPPDGS